MDSKNDHGRELAKLGASKGGKARAEALSDEEKREIARSAANARWSGDLPYATHDGKIIIADMTIQAAVLNTGTRVLTQETFLQAVGRAGKAKGRTGSSVIRVNDLPPFIAADNLKPFITDDLRQSTAPVLYRTTKGGRAFGYNAMLLPMVADVYLNAEEAGALLKNQEHIAKACHMLIRGLARIGIIALVDEATGFQDDRAKDELQQILNAYIAEELRPWTLTFPEEFFKQVYRLHSWNYRPGMAKKTPFVGKLINKYVYEKLPDRVLEKLRSLNPVLPQGYRKHKHFQFLTDDIGNPHLRNQILAVTTIMKVSDNQKDFEEKFARVFPSPGQQERLPLVVEVAKDA